MLLKRVLVPDQPSPTRIISFRFHSSSINKDSIYLHVAPNDVWIAPSIFAAKHLEPSYVKSIPIPPNTCPDTLLEMLEDDVELQRQVYDTGALPEQVLTLATKTSASPDENGTQEK